MEKKNLMLQAPYPIEYATEKVLSELVELSESDLRQIVGGSDSESEAPTEDEPSDDATLNETDRWRWRWPRIKILIWC